MTTTDLKAAAEAAKAATAAYIAYPTDRETGRQWDRACAEFSLACTEDAILALIRERDEALREKAAAMGLQQGTAALLPAARARSREPDDAWHQAANAILNLIRERDDTLAALAVAREGAKDALASLVAAVSLLERGGKKAAASDKMFGMMLSDYKASIARTRAALKEATDGR